MMTKTVNVKSMLIRQVLLLPVLAAAVFLFSTKVEAQTTASKSGTRVNRAVPKLQNDLKNELPTEMTQPVERRVLTADIAENPLAQRTIKRADVVEVMVRNDSRTVSLFQVSESDISKFRVSDFITGEVLIVGGSVRQPGAYSNSTSLTLSDLVARAGGFKTDTIRKNIEISAAWRPVSKDAQAKKAEDVEEISLQKTPPPKEPAKVTSVGESRDVFAAIGLSNSKNGVSISRDLVGLSINNSTTKQQLNDYKSMLLERGIILNIERTEYDSKNKLKFIKIRVVCKDDPERFSGTAAQGLEGNNSVGFYRIYDGNGSFRMLP